MDKGRSLNRMEMKKEQKFGTSGGKNIVSKNMDKYNRFFISSKLYLMVKAKIKTQSDVVYEEK